MNILVDIRLLGRGGFSGVEEYTRQIVTHLLRIDTQNHYQLFYNGVRKNPLPEEWTERKNVSVIDWRIPNRLLDACSRFLGMPAVDRLLKADVVFSPHFNILKVAQVPHIVTFHDLSFLHHPYFFNTRQKFWHWLQDYRGQAEKAASIIADSEFTKSDLIQTLGIPEKKITVVYPGLDQGFRKLAANDPGLTNFKKRHNISFPYLLYLGTLEPRKNVTAIVRAFNIIKRESGFQDLRLVIAGSPGWLNRDVIREIAASKAKNHILLWGAVENRDKIFLYNGASAFIYPSFFEGFGFPPLEAQACGTPVIVADRTSLPEIIGSSGLLTDPWRVGDLSASINSVLRDTDLREKLKHSGLANAKRFSWPVTAEKILECLKQETKKYSWT